MMYTQDCTHIYQQPEWQSTIHGISHEGLLSHLQDLRSSLPLFQLIDQDHDLPALISLADHIQDHFTDVIILGTGGSSLGGQALCELRQNNHPRLHFHDNIDPHTFERLFNHINPSRTAVIAISKSGNTAETLMQLLVCLQHWLTILPEDQLRNHFWIIAENNHNGIREIANYYRLPCLDHPSDIGGRFAAFTLVGLLPALIAGVDALAIRKGARQILDDLQNAQHPSECSSVEGALINFGLLQSGFTQSVLFPYIDRLSIFALWYRQLWAESLGKNGLGTTPIRAIGTIDQHSQLQLYLDGPKDKLFTVITMSHKRQLFTIEDHHFEHSSLTIFKKKSMGQLMAAEQKATINSLNNNKCPTRILHLDQVSEYSLGALMMHFILETLGMAYLLDVNPFDQPAVEESKILTRQYLAESS